MESQSLGMSLKELGRRSKLETLIDILRAIAEGAERPTHIMYRANLSWAALQIYLGSLVTRGLIVTWESGGRRKYQLSDEGFRVMNHFLRVRQALDLEEIPA